MFEFFKNLFGSRPSEDGVSSRIESPAPRPAPTPSTSFRTRAAVATPPQPADPKASNILLPLQTVIESLPPEFKSRVQQMDLTGATLTISIDRIMAQLPTGAVKLSFGELRRAAPQLFSPENDLDEVPVPLPLSEILQRLHPAMLQRRSNQKRMDLPPDLGSPFGDRGQGLAFSISPARPAEAPAPSRAATPARPVPPRPVAPPVTPAAPAVPQQPAPVQPVARPPIKPSVPLGTPARHASPPAQPSPIAPAPVGRPVQPTPVV
ncbi:MAG TPA: hypothetical protein PKH32_08260, partial [Verrucomicrobiota bacterium]|nr:hypothetical protein [Verrucomicrobiota bacterium]